MQCDIIFYPCKFIFSFLWSRGLRAIFDQYEINIHYLSSLLYKCHLKFVDRMSFMFVSSFYIQSFVEAEAYWPLTSMYSQDVLRVSASLMTSFISTHLTICNCSCFIIITKYKINLTFPHFLKKQSQYIKVKTHGLHWFFNQLECCNQYIF